MKAIFSHVMNDDITGITFIFFDSGHIQELDNQTEIDFYSQFCIHMQESDTNKLIAALQKEPTQHLTVFNEAEMKELRKAVDFVQREGYLKQKPAPMSDREWKEFLNKLS